MPLSHHSTPDDPNMRQPIQCPKCGERADIVDVSGVVIDRCPACGGIWLDATELKPLREAHGVADRVDRGGPQVQPAQGQKGAVLCPRDRSMLIRMSDPEQPHVRFESCTVCGGIFLDAGELRDLANLTLLERLRAMLG